TLKSHAPEIFQDETGNWYISSVEWPNRGVSVDKLEWVEQKVIPLIDTFNLDVKDILCSYTLHIAEVMAASLPGSGVLLVTGGGTGSEAIAITLPTATGISMEVAIDCSSATVAIVDEYSIPIVSFDNVQVIGANRNCSGPVTGGMVPWNTSYELGN
ncbi:MAG: hypothetical protein P8Y54_03385, partial [Xanthomonadales bacterium]